MTDNIKLPLITDDFRELVHYNPNTDDIVDAVQELMREAVRLNAQQPLTNEQIEDIADDIGHACVIASGDLGREVIWYDGDLSSFARAIERAHGIGIKND